MCTRRIYFPILTVALCSYPTTQQKNSSVYSVHDPILKLPNEDVWAYEGVQPPT